MSGGDPGQKVDTGAKVERPRNDADERRPAQESEDETVVTLATALPRSRSVAPRPAAPSNTGAATEMPAPPRETDESDLDGGRRSCDRESESREKRAAGEQGAIAQAVPSP